MVAYAIPRDRRTAVAKGEQSFLMLSPRGNVGRHAQVGERMQIKPGRAETAKPIDALCVVRATVHIAKDGVRRVIDERRIAMGEGSTEGDVILRRFVQAENAMPNAEAEREKLAKDAGHDDWANLWTDTIREARGRGELKGGVYVRELVGWKVAT
jgi:hypothetical protein